jgi:DNA-directed RNA polymerase specialized sigma24 family protein
MEITDLVERFRSGDRDAGDQLWRHFHSSLAVVARRKYSSVISAVSDEEDLVQSVFMALWKAAANHTLGNIVNRDSFWWLLLTVTKRKVLNRVEAANTQKRDTQTVHLSELQEGRNGEDKDLIADLKSPTAEMLAALADEESRLMGLLRDDGLRQVAQFKLEGLNHREIARRLHVSYRTVERKVQLIRDLWAKEAQCRQPT